MPRAAFLIKAEAIKLFSAELKGRARVIYLNERTSGRDNNLNLIRAIAATAVLVSHAFPITLGPGATEPFSVSTGHSLGGLAVYAFFAISGFLISMSFMRSSSWLSFLAARFLRLVPGLVVSLLLVAFVLGPIVTSLSPGAYFTHIETYTFVIRNTLLAPLQFTLPGVFETQPYTAVEGSIWTLFYEVICYMGVFALGIVGILGKRLWMALIFAAYLAVWLLIEAKGGHPRLMALQDLSLPFVIGMAFYLWQDRLPLSFIGVVVLSGLAWALRDLLIYDLALVLALSYAVFWLGYVPGGLMRAYNRLGDYSYGIYIYAFPLQGAAVWALGPQSPLTNMIVAFVPTLILSVLSWHLIEGPALNAKSALMARLGRAHPAA